jgi:long-chain acyl-CoA synthetase
LAKGRAWIVRSSLWFHGPSALAEVHSG